ncbi:zinc finger CCCH domain-containing protein 66-like isoform X1 [Salvia miltiorrhiza]|uniref:zinc finger CCCH domain-containing protein 66-like isoform X1 n=1 Tax=Salvia miltiorrhiza TaxID=226208 RepID=UPI0025AD4EB3|nr:zinc finger CCCH domain-containing protein 66-like isoform X1 [Salvia miltiorrhiza]
MPGNRKFSRNGSTSDRVDEAMRRLKVEESDDNGGAGDELGSYPDRPGEPDCIYYLRTGSCGYGSNCRFNHPSSAGQVYGVKTSSELPERAGQPDCGHYLKTGTCKYGSTCRYHHPKDRQADFLLNMLGLPMRQDAKPCPFYMRTGLCKYGYACKFHHPQPTLAAANVLPVVGPVYGSGGSAVVPSSGASSASVASVSAASLSKATYFASSLQVPQSYMPLFLPPSQGWNTYMGGASPLSVTSVLTGPVSNGQLSYLPERPDQPECRYFMEHGSCKYGSECKYHHPREKLSQLVSTSLGPLGLPLRPGQPVCSYYSLYGLCKYGPTCRFDHPMDGHNYAYSLSVPPPAFAYSSPAPYQRTTSLMPVADASPTKSSKLSDWIKKEATVSDKHLQNSNTKSVGESLDQSDSLPHSSKASSEVHHDESD